MEYLVTSKGYKFDQLWSEGQTFVIDDQVDDDGEEIEVVASWFQISDPEVKKKLDERIAAKAAAKEKDRLDAEAAAKEAKEKKDAEDKAAAAKEAKAASAK